MGVGILLGDRVQRNAYAIPRERLQSIALRYHAITRVVNRTFWESDSDTAHSFYVGSYGRGTATRYSDIDVLMEIPKDQFLRYDAHRGNGQSHLLSALRKAVQQTYSTSEVHADGQIVQLLFSDRMKFELLPALREETIFGASYRYPDSNMGGKWLTTRPKAEQAAMRELDKASNGLLFDTCKHIRFLHQKYFREDHLSGIVVDSLVYWNLGDWHWVDPGTAEEGQAEGCYEKFLLDGISRFQSFPCIEAPGSKMQMDASTSMECLRMILERMAMG